MKGDDVKPRGNCKMSMLSVVKNSIFWWNLLVAIAITVVFFLFERDAVSYLIGCMGILNWLIAISIIVKAFRH